jgi:hypothetical protein
MKKQLISVLCLVLLAAGLVHAQTAQEILDKAIQAKGGAKLNDLKSVKMEGTLNAMGMDIPTKMVAINKRGLRTEIEVMGQNIIMAIDGAKGWTINPLQGGDAAADLPEDQVKALSGQMDLSGLASFKTEGTVELLGKEGDAYKIKMVSKDGSTVINFFDATTYNIVKTIVTVELQGQKADVETKYSNYKMVDGVSFPFTIETSNPQAGQITYNFTKIEVNPTIDEKIFAKPN